MCGRWRRTGGQKDRTQAEHLPANDLDRLRGLLKDGTSANTKDDHGVTPVMAAAAAGSLDAMKVLLEKGADSGTK